MRVSVPYLVAKKNRDGSMRFYWQPSKKLAAAGWETLTLPPDLALATKRAEAENEKLRTWYTNGRPRLAAAQPNVEADGAVKRGSVWHLIALYKDPPKDRPGAAAGDDDGEGDDDNEGVFGFDYRGLKPATKRSYDACLDYIGKWMGPLPVRKVTKAIILERLKAIAMQRHESGPNKGKRKIATAFLIGRVGRMLFNASRSLVDESHPCFVREAENPWTKLRTRERRRARPILWTREGRDLMIDAALKLDWMSMAAAIRLNWWLGQREGDIIGLGHNFNPGEVLDLVQSKTAGSVHLPVAMVPEIGQTIDELRADQRERFGNVTRLRLLIDERNGLPWDEHRFRKAFQTIRECAIEEALWCIRHQVPGWEGRTEAWVDRHLRALTFMRLRHTVVTMLYRAGATIPEIAAITGHTISSVNQIIERYGVRDEITAGNALQKRLDREGV